MPQSAIRRPRLKDAGTEYYYRRPLGLRETLSAIGVGIGAGLLAFYVVRVLMQRTPLRGPSALDRAGRERTVRP